MSDSSQIWQDALGDDPEKKTSAWIRIEELLCIYARSDPRFGRLPESQSISIAMSAVGDLLRCAEAKPLAFPTDYHLKSYLRKQVNHKITDRLRRRNRGGGHQQFPTSQADGIADPKTLAGPEALLEEMELLQSLSKDPELKEILELRLSGHVYREIAEQLNMSLSAVYARVRRFLRDIGGKGD